MTFVAPGEHAALTMDNDDPAIGNSPSTDDSRGRLHVKISNTASEPIPATFTGTITIASVSQGAPGLITGAWPVLPTDGTNSQAFTALGEAKVSVTSFPGSITANQGGVWTVQPGNTANTTPWLITLNQGGNSAFITGANALKVDGSAVTQPVSIAGTVPISGTITVIQPTAANLNATVTGTVGATQSGAWNITNISGSITLPTNAAQETGGHLASIDSKLVLDANSILETASPTRVASGSITTAVGSNVQIECSGMSTVIARITGTWTGSINFQAAIVTTPGPSDWFGLNGVDYITLDGQLSFSATSGIGSGVYIYNAAGFKWIRLVGAPISTGTASINLSAGGGASVQAAILNATFVEGTVAATQSGPWSMQLQDGSGNTISSTTHALDVNLKTSSITLPISGSVTVSGTITANQGGSWTVASTQSGSWTVAATQSGTWSTRTQDGSGTAITSTGAALDVNIKSSSATLSITGTVSANQSGTWNINNITGSITLPTGAATDSSVTGLQVSQGVATSGQRATLILGAVTTAAPTYTTATSNPLSLTTAGALRTDSSAVTQPISGSVSVSNFPATQPVSGTITANQGGAPWSVSGSGNFTVVQATAANLNATVTGTVGATQSGTWTVQQGSAPWSVSQSGTWTTGRTWTLANGTDSVASVQSGAWNITNITGTITLPTNAAQETGGNLATIVSSLTNGTQKAVVSAVSLPLPTNAAQESGGNLDSINQILQPGATQTVATEELQLELLDRLPQFLGPQIPSLSLSTVVSLGPTTSRGFKSNVAASASSVGILIANAFRKAASVFNDSTVNMYLDTTGGTASTSSFTVKIAPNQFYAVDFGYLGAINATWDSATGNARVTEYT